jgi:hypothetical protein
VFAVRRRYIAVAISLGPARVDSPSGTHPFRFLNRAGRVLRHARRHMVVLSHLALPLAEIVGEPAPCSALLRPPPSAGAAV